MRAQLAREDTLVVTARDKVKAALLGLAVFTIESRSVQHQTPVLLQQFARVNIFPAASLSVTTAACRGRRRRGRGRRGSPSTA